MKSCIISIVLVLIFILSNVNIYAADESETNISYRLAALEEQLSLMTEETIEAVLNNFADMKTHWSRRSVGMLTELDIVTGRPGGTFAPNDEVLTEEFITMVVRSLGYKPGLGKSYWAEPFIDIALEQGIIEEGEFADYKQPLNREQMAKIIILATMLKEEKPDNELDHMISMNIIDLQYISDDYAQHVITAYRMGIITGTPNGTFNPDSTLTRAEASTVIIRSVSDNERIPFDPANSYAIELPNYTKYRIDLGDVRYKQYTSATYIVSRPDKREQMKIACLIENSKVKSDGYIYGVYNEPDQNIAYGFNISKEAVYEDKYSDHMAISVRLNNPQVFMDITVWDAELTRNIHKDVINDIFEIIFEKDSVKAMNLFDKFIEYGINSNKAQLEEVSLNSMQVQFSKDSTSTFSVRVYSK